MRFKKTLAFMLTTALCVVMPTAVFAQEVPAPTETPESAFTEEALADIPKLKVEIYRQETCVAPVGSGISISIDSTVPDSMVELMVDKIVTSLARSLSEDGKSIADAQGSIRVTTPSPEQVEQFLAEAETKATRRKECDWSDHSFYQIKRCHHEKVSEDRCEYYEKRLILCRNCNYDFEEIDTVINAHCPGEMPGCTNRIAEKKLP